MDYLFKIGDVLTHKGFSPDRAVAQRFFVVERSSVECPGGTQRHYTCRAISPSTQKWVKGCEGVSSEFFSFNEVELMLWDDLPAQAEEAS